MKFSRKAKRESSWILLFTICLALVYILTFGDGGFVQLRQYRAELQGLQMENLNLRQRHREYLERISRLKADPSEVERIARERYNFARPGDIIVNLQD
jgi:cell division protein FtsB